MNESECLLSASPSDLMEQFVAPSAVSPGTAYFLSICSALPEFDQPCDQILLLLLCPTASSGRRPPGLSVHL
ncbi:hypothetical protein KHT87_22185, partial [Alkalihalobacillus clausii]|uniref:hypothetical protein n=1 Tax=Shouchella clausii TaxID=79880 RepID=UPI001C0B29AA